MCALYLDTRNRPLGWTVAHIGTINRAAVEPRSILVTGLDLNAAGFVIAHNHPSGDPSPSAEDLAFTRRMAEAGELVGIRLIDHIILGDDDRWISLRQRGDVLRPRHFAVLGCGASPAREAEPNWETPTSRFRTPALSELRGWRHGRMPPGLEAARRLRS